MEAAAIISAIKASQELTALAIAGRDGEIAKQITPEQKPKSFLLKTADVLKLFNRSGSPHNGGVVLKKLRDLGTQDSPAGNNTAEIVRLMDGPGWELMDNATPKILEAWKTANVLTEAHIDAIKELATESVRPSYSEVSKSLRPFRPEGKVGALVGF